ncbi:lamin tail domain-containing protein [Negadavirga shengliensis]|uniref:Lamin tail domain-containing protein n=1 Tax=Negadavirga shengliensis TaxID=1389218 RepID=A0ABV9SVI4_9BACT
MKTCIFVWGFIAFSILGFALFEETETFIDQDFESNFMITNHPEEFLPNWSANDVRASSMRVFQASGEGINGSQALGIQTIGSFDAQIYIKTSTIGLKNSRISFQAKTGKNGSGNRPVEVYYSFSEDSPENFGEMQPIGTPESFPNEDTPYQEYLFEMPSNLLGKEVVFIRLDVRYGQGSGTAARLFIDDFIIHGEAGEPDPREEDPGSEDPDIEDPIQGKDSLKIEQIERYDDKGWAISFGRNDLKEAFDIKNIGLNHGYGEAVNWALNDSLLWVEFGDYLYPNHYELTIEYHEKSEEDTEMWLAHDLEWVSPVPFGTIVINEFMADPNPKGSVPPDPVLPTATNDEYIELYNRSDKPILLTGFTYNDGAVEPVTLEGGGYVLLVPASKTTEFNQWGPTTGVSPFRALSNNSGQIHIADAFGVIDSLNYDTSWYQDSDKTRGGWSLERMDPYISCQGSFNWKASVSDQGGTPGMRNSVYETGPSELSLVEVTVLEASHIEVWFSGNIDPAFHDGIQVLLEGKAVLPEKITAQSIHFSSPVPLTSGNSYLLEIKNLRDCYGNPPTDFSYVLELSGEEDGKDPGPDPGDPIEEPDDLSINRVEKHGENSLAVHFNELIDGIEFTSAMLSPGYGSPENWEIQDSVLVLDFGEYLYSNRFELTLNYGERGGIDPEVKLLVHDFDWSSPTPFGAVIINEFMADPNPKGLAPPDPVLPTASTDEYIELHNRTDKPIRLAGFTYNGGIISDLTLEAGGFALLCPASKTEVFSQWASAAGVSPFRALPNGSGEILLADAFGVIDSLSYDTSWYRDAQKSQGGWSLERINPYVSCTDRYNWKASVSSQGGTPGAVNSVFSEEPDPRPFIIREVRLNDENQIEVLFSKIPDSKSRDSIKVYFEDTLAELQSMDTEMLTLTNPLELVSGESYLLEITGVRDCYGLGLDERYYTFTYDTEPPVLIGISALADDEFKLYFDEPLDLYRSLHSDQFGIVPYEGQIKNLQALDSQTIQMALDPPLELGQAYQFYARNILDLTGNRADKTALEFYLDDQLDTLVFSGPTHLQVQYKIPVDSVAAVQLHSYLLNKNPVQPERVYRDATSPLYFHLLFREELPANTPLELRVEGIKDMDGNPINTLKKSFIWDTRSIAITDVDVRNDSTLWVTFNKSMDEKHALIHQNYTVNEGIGNPEKIHFKAPNAAELQFRKKFANRVDYQLSIRNLRDVYGVEMPRTINRAFVYDVIPPEIISASLISPFEVRIDFDKPVMFPENVAVGGLVHLDWEMDGEKSLLVKSQIALKEDEIRIKFPELQDLLGNTAYDLEYRLDNSLPQIGQAYLWDAHHLVLCFSHFLDPSLSILPDRYLVNHKGIKYARLKENGFELELELFDGLRLGDSVAVEVLEVKNKRGSSGHKLETSLTYDDGITAVWPENSQMIQVYHETALDLNTPLLGSFKLADDPQNIEAIHNQSNPAHLKLVLESPLLEGQVYQLQVPPRLGENQKIHPGSIRLLEWDTIPPKLVEVEVITEYELRLHFDEPLDPILAVVPGFYEINGTHPMEVLPLSHPNQVLLVFEQAFHSGMPYELSIQHIEDRHGNSVNETVLSFIMDEIAYPNFRDIVINEVMAAPRPSQTLPHVEYVEIYNASDKTYYLGGYLLANSRTTTVFPRETIDPKEHVILCPINQVQNFMPYGRVIGLNHWPTLLNEEDEVSISDRRGTLIDRFVYNTGTYGSGTIAQSGYSLELVNPYYPCISDQNIRPSQDAKRGTPGKMNSVFDDSPDRTRPQLLAVEVKSLDKLSLVFSKPLAHVDIPGILLVPRLNVSEVYQDTADLSRVWVVLGENLKDNQAYTLQISGWKDCVGNNTDPLLSQAEFKIPGKPEEGDIVLNEVLFNPRTGGPKFVEIYNQSTKYLNLKNWKLANFANEEISNRRVISGQDLILEPFSYLVLTTDADRLLQHYPKGKFENFHQMTSLPSYPITSGTVILLDPEEQWVERFDYHERMHHSFLRDLKGISLERYGVHAEVNNPHNWHSASADAGYATPGYKNSQTYGEKQAQDMIVVDPPVFVPNAPGERPFATIHYQLERPGYMASLKIFSSTGIQVKAICENELWGEKGFYTWNGTNENGTKVTPGYYVLWGELVHPDGSVKQIKKTMVVGAKF